MSQGEGDGLCGLYATFNVLQSISGIQETVSTEQGLFDVLKAFVTLDEVWNGMHVQKLIEMLRAGARYIPERYDGPHNYEIHSVNVPTNKSALLRLFDDNDYKYI